MSEAHMQIRAVLFDLGNVLFLADHRRTIEAYIQRHGVPRELAEGYFQRPDYAAFGRGELTTKQFCERLKKEWPATITPEEIWHIHGHHVYAIDHGAMELVDRLGPVMPIGFVTNTCEMEYARYVSLDLRFVYPFKVWRSDVYCFHKADPGVPNAIVRKWIPTNLGITIAHCEVLFIDDSKKNCDAFEAAGARVFQYTKREPWLLEAHLRQLGLM